MKDHEFYQKYANMPLGMRQTEILIDEVVEYSTPNKIYLEVKEIDDKIRKDIFRKERLIRAFEEFCEGL